MLRLFALIALLVIFGCDQFEPRKENLPPVPAEPWVPPPERTDLERIVIPEARLNKSTVDAKKLTNTHIEIPTQEKDKLIIVPYFFAEEGFTYLTLKRPTFKSVGCPEESLFLPSTTAPDTPVYIMDWEIDPRDGLFLLYNKKEELFGNEMHSVGIKFEAPKECKTIDMEIEAFFEKE